MARPAIALKVPRGSTAVAKMTQTRKNVRIASTSSRRPGAQRLVDDRDAGVLVDLAREDDARGQRAEDRSGELGGDVDAREHGRDPPGDEEPERHGGVEVAARDVPDRRDHDRDHEPVRERDADQAVGAADEDRAHAHEDQCEGAYELGDSAPEGVVLGREPGLELVHAARVGAASDGTRRAAGARLP